MTLLNESSNHYYLRYGKQDPMTDTVAANETACL